MGDARDQFVEDPSCFATRGFSTVIASIGIIRISGGVAVMRPSSMRVRAARSEERIERVEAIGVEQNAVLFGQSQLRRRDVDAGQQVVVERLVDWPASIRIATVMSGRRPASSRIFQRSAPAASGSTGDDDRGGELVVDGQQVGRRISSDRAAELARSPAIVSCDDVADASCGAAD